MAGVVYFLLVLAVGWVLGPVRELWAVLRFGRNDGLLSEVVIMLIPRRGFSGLHNGIIREN
jgi:hypothetical protein